GRRRAARRRRRHPPSPGRGAAAGQIPPQALVFLSPSGVASRLAICGNPLEFVHEGLAMNVQTPAAQKPGFSAEEWTLRVGLAGCYRIFDHSGWSEVIMNHITVRVPGPEHHFLINPYGLTYAEVTASNLVKIDLNGKIIGHSDWPVNPAGFVIH